MNKVRTATVSQVNGYIKRVIDNNIHLADLWVKGEISNYKKHYSGHIYLTLKDEGGVLKAVMFKGNTQTLMFRPDDGMKVMARGRIGVYEQGGVYQLYIEEMRPDGIGELYIAYERLKKQLEEEGLFDKSKKKPIPKYPKTIGVVTASTGAAVRDIINVITRRSPMTEIILYPAQVQGYGAAESICVGIDYFNRTKSADTIIVGRGGGSIEDLWAFNEEITARKIFESDIPIISAVGHETDFTIADFVADLRVPTPSAAAEIAVPSQEELYKYLMTLDNTIRVYMKKHIEERQMRLLSVKLPDLSEKIGSCRKDIEIIEKNMKNAFEKNMMMKKEKFGSLCAKLDSLSPVAVMARGYAVPMDKNNKTIRSAGNMKIGDEFLLKMSDGNVGCSVIDTQIKL